MNLFVNVWLVRVWICQLAPQKQEQVHTVYFKIHFVVEKVGVGILLMTFGTYSCPDTSLLCKAEISSTPEN